MAREAAWLARCVGRGEWAPLSDDDLEALSARLRPLQYQPGALLFAQGTMPEAVWVVRGGRIELSVREGARRLILQILHPGDVEGDIGVILQMPLAYSGRAVDRVDALRLSAEDFERLIADRPALARRWLSSVAFRLAGTQRRILQLSGRDLRTQLANLLLDEARDGAVALPQESLAALLGVRRPSLNKILREFERDGLVRLAYACVEIGDDSRLARTAGRGG